MNSTINKTDEDSLLIKKMKNGDTSAIEYSKVAEPSNPTK